MGQSWYTPAGVYEFLPKDKTFSVDAASVKEDLIDFLNALSAESRPVDVQVPRLKGSYQQSYEDPRQLFPTHLSNLARENLERILVPDYDVYNFLTKAAHRQRGEARPRPTKPSSKLSRLIGRLSR